MATMTAAQHTRIRRKLDIEDEAQLPWTDAEWDDMYTEAGENDDKTLVLALRELLMSASKRNSYKVGQSSEDLSEIFENLWRMLHYLEEEVVGGAQQVRLVGMRSVPYQYHEMPGSGYDLSARRWRRRYWG